MMKRIGGWLKKERSMIVGTLLMAALLIVCTLLYGENVASMKLTLWMCGFFFFFWCLLSLYFYWKRSVAVTKANKELQHSIDSLPIPQDAIEEQYQDMIQTLYDRGMALEHAIRERESEEKDYYTRWAHQIKTPIAAMRLILQNMENQTRVSQLSQELTRVEQYAGMALQYVRLQENGTDLKIESCDVYEITKQVLKQYKNVFIEKKLSLVFEPFSCSIVTDEKWFAFILEQVLSNAVKYTNQGGISITCTEQEDVWLMSIQDTGIGIRKEDLPRIFEKGFTGYNGHMDTRSTGIGLYLCKRTADMLGIRLQTDSTLQQGTRIQLFLAKKI